MRPSATILLLRDAPAFQVLMVERHYEIDFAAGALVFPGGKVCEDDHSADWDARFDGQVAGAMRALQIAAIRELYEEAGIVLARPERARGAGQPLVGRDATARLAPYREDVDRGRRSLSAICAEHELVLAGDALVHFGHWITPDIMTKRFDTHFFLAVLPDGQRAEQDGREATDAIWLEPDEALQKAEAGEVTIIFPTRMNLGRLNLASNADEAVQKFSGEPVTTVLPKLDKSHPDGPCLVIPKVEGYSQTREPISRVANVEKKKQS
ncbi:MAG: NUDIX hydrolase [Hyphomonadaceae bacterium]|nr:NUDIX hydrolase [Hyphomonadaceae bacterium]